MNIFLTWDSSGIGKFIFEKLSWKYNIFWVSRTGQYKVDLAQKEDIENFVKNIKDINFDVLVLNAGIGTFGPFENNDLENYEQIINVNLLANIRLLKLLEKNINKKTKIIFIGSIIWKKFMKWASVYQASKFGLRGFAWWLKSEWKKVFIINPKIVETTFHPENLPINPKWEKTSLDSIYEVVNNIILWKEKRFEIDL